MRKRKAEEPIDPEVGRRCFRVLDIAFRGIHHVDGWWNRRALWGGVEISTRQDLSTFDFDLLTRLVVAAHDEAVRVSVSPSGPGMVKIMLWPRQREGDFSKRHPTMEQAIEGVRKWEVRP